MVATNQHRRKIKERLRQSEESLPVKLRDRSDRWVLERKVAENYAQLSKHLDFVYNEFLIERTLVKRCRVSPAELVAVSRSLLSSLLTLTGNRHHLGSYNNDLPWLVSIKMPPPLSESLRHIDCFIWSSTSRSPCARAFTSFAQQATDDSRFPTVRDHPEPQQSDLVD